VVRLLVRLLLVGLVGDPVCGAMAMSLLLATFPAPSACLGSQCYLSSSVRPVCRPSRPTVSGEIPQEPVVSRKTGHLFEKRLIEKHLASSSTCPVTGGDLSVEDLVPLQSSRTVQPRDVTATSIPGILSLFQKEWDAVMLESFTLKQNIQTLRQELSQALYQHDAACRVIARLVKERDQAIAAYQDVQQRGGSTGASAGAASGAVTAAGAAAPDGKSVPPHLLQAILAKAEELRPARKSRTAPATLATKAQVATLKLSSAHTPHSASKPGITCVDVHSTQDNVVATGGVDKAIKVFDSVSKKVSATINGHSKKITTLAWHPTQAVLFSGSEDATVRVWAAAGEKCVLAKPTWRGGGREGVMFAGRCRHGGWLCCCSCWLWSWPWRWWRRRCSSSSCCCCCRLRCCCCCCCCCCCICFCAVLVGVKLSRYATDGCNECASWWLWADNRCKTADVVLAALVIRAPVPPHRMHWPHALADMARRSASHRTPGPSRASPCTPRAPLWRRAPSTVPGSCTTLRPRRRCCPLETAHPRKRASLPSRELKGSFRYLLPTPPRPPPSPPRVQPSVQRGGIVRLHCSSRDTRDSVRGF
jgi:hypothetical protein